MAPFVEKRNVLLKTLKELIVLSMFVFGLASSKMFLQQSLCASAYSSELGGLWCSFRKPCNANITEATFKEHCIYFVLQNCRAKDLCVMFEKAGWQF
jgi:hypothetical protein